MSKKRILIVEDEQLLNEAYQTILTREGYDVDSAFDGKEALEKVKDADPDLILLDLRMPRVDGLDFLREYKPSTEHPNVKIIVFSNLDEQSEIESAFELGAQKYIMKAWATPKELVRIAADMLANPVPADKA